MENGVSVLRVCTVEANDRFTSYYPVFMPGGDHCCVPRCTSDWREKQESLVLFHTLPKDKLLVKKWIHAIRRDVGPIFQRDTCVCSQHFTDDQYCQGRKAKGARLKKGAVPHVFAWMADGEDSASSRRKIPRDRAIRESAVQLAPHLLAVSWERTAGSSAASCWPSTAAVKCECHG